MAKEDPTIGYMKRMKEILDEIHPEYSFLTEKNLRDQASRIEKTRMLWTLNMYILDHKLMNQPTIETTIFRLPIIQTAVVVENHNLI